MIAVRRGFFVALGWRVHRFLYRRSHGRIGARVGRLPVPLLRTSGRRSGRVRDVTLNYLEDERDFVVIASYAGEDRHPAWYLNLESRPEAEVWVGGKVFRVRARTAAGAERERLWRRVLREDPTYVEYARRTPREIPVVILRPLDGGA